MVWFVSTALLFNSDFNPRLKLIKNGLHLWPRRSLRSWTACAAGKSKSPVEAREQRVAAGMLGAFVCGSFACDCWYSRNKYQNNMYKE